MSLFIVRHGETTWNAARIVQLPETPLSTRGVAQAERLAERLARAGVALVLSSDHVRAAMTAERIHTRTGAAVVYDPNLRERDFGAVRGTPYADLTVDIFAPDYVPPDGESWESFHARVRTAWDRVVTAVAATDGNIVVVTHGLVCRSLIERQLTLPPELAAPAGWANAAVTEVEARPPWRVRVLDCTAHLDPETGTGDAASDRPRPAPGVA